MSSQPHGGSLTGIMGQMMGNQNAAGMTTAMPGYVWLAIAVFVGLTMVGIAGVAYFFAVPEIKTSQVPVSTPGPVSQAKESPTVEWTSLLRTSKPEERRVLEVLASHGGRYLQKFVVKEAGLSRLKAHRIISRFAERGVVTAVHSGNTNEIALAPWLMKDAVTTGN
ncbi:MAG TPA: hypothetical protein VGR56_10290 [Nitrososphaerales archaeon]|nr:hypothetical protein [Nitrososphaerales archaeon]